MKPVDLKAFAEAHGQYRTKQGKPCRVWKWNSDGSLQALTHLGQWWMKDYKELRCFLDKN